MGNPLEGVGASDVRDARPSSIPEGIAREAVRPDLLIGGGADPTLARPVSHMYGEMFMGTIIDPPGKDYVTAIRLTGIKPNPSHQGVDARGCKGVRVWRAIEGGQIVSYVRRTYIELTPGKDVTMQEAKREEVRHALGELETDAPASIVTQDKGETDTPVGIAPDSSSGTTTINVAEEGPMRIASTGAPYS